MRFSTLIATVIVLGFASLSFGASYQVDASHSQVGFRVKHLFSKVPGRFQRYTANFDYDKDMKATGNFVAEIETASINTDDTKRDDHLRSADFFDATKFSKITFKSTAVKPKDGQKFVIVGDLTMHGVTKPVELEAEYLGETGFMGNTKAGFHISGTVKRKDWGISWNKVLDSGNLLIGDDVELDVLIEANQVPPKKKA